jgi:cell division protein FtsB
MARALGADGRVIRGRAFARALVKSRIAVHPMPTPGATSPHSSHTAPGEDRVIRPTQRPALDSPITLRRIAIVLIAGICGLVAFAVYGQVAQSRNLDAQVNALAAQNSALVRQISDREREIADAQTVAWLEQEARQLGYIFPGEHLFIIRSPGSGTPASGGVSVPVPEFKPPSTPTPSPSASATPGATPTPTARPVTVPSPSPTPH